MEYRVQRLGCEIQVSRDPESSLMVVIQGTQNPLQMWNWESGIYEEEFGIQGWRSRIMDGEPESKVGNRESNFLIDTGLSLMG